MSGFILIFFDDFQPDPSSSVVVDGQPETSSKPGSAKNGRLPSAVGQGHESAVIHTGSNFEQAVTYSIPALKPVNLRPDCLKPDQCSGYGSHQCYSCTKTAEVA